MFDYSFLNCKPRTKFLFEKSHIRPNDFFNGCFIEKNFSTKQITSLMDFIASQKCDVFIFNTFKDFLKLVTFIDLPCTSFFIHKSTIYFSTETLNFSIQFSNGSSLIFNVCVPKESYKITLIYNTNTPTFIKKISFKCESGNTFEVKHNYDNNFKCVYNHKNFISKLTFNNFPNNISLFDYFYNLFLHLNIISKYNFIEQELGKIEVPKYANFSYFVFYTSNFK